MLDIVLFRTDQGGNPDLVRESQRRRYADVTLVDKVIEHDTEWRKSELHSLSLSLLSSLDVETWTAADSVLLALTP